MCALICIILSTLIFINIGANQIGFLLFHLITIYFCIWYLIRFHHTYHTDDKYITEDQLLYLGFSKIPHFTIGNDRLKDLGRNRYISLSSLGTPNEMIFICEKNESDDLYPEEIINLHNFDYDGYITFNKLKKICNIFPKTDENGFSRKK